MVDFERVDGVLEDGKRAEVVRVELVNKDEMTINMRVGWEERTGTAYFAMLR